MLNEQWWRRPSQFDQLSNHLRARGMTTLIRVRIAASCVSLALITLVAMLNGPVGPRNGLQKALLALTAVAALGGAVLWALRWPTRRQGVVFAVAASTAITVAALAQSEPAVGLFFCSGFAVMAVHLAIFHAAPVMAYNLACTAVVAVIESARLIPTIGLDGALAASLLVLMASLAAPLGLYVVTQSLGFDAIRADRDPLTGLLNRSAFYARAERVFDGECCASDHFVIAVIDLDRFKQLNDTYGHAAGDDALAAVARALSDNLDANAVIGRIGGEEFAVADFWPIRDIASRAQRLCAAIAALPAELTASIGTASIAPNQTGVARVDAVLAELMSAADAAMYVAKRKGGNQNQHHGTSVA